MLFGGYRDKFGATRGVFEWLIYCVTVTVKLDIYYFYIFNGNFERTEVSNDNDITGYDISNEILVLTRSYAFSMMIYLLPLLFAFWFGRGSQEMFGGAFLKSTTPKNHSPLIKSMSSDEEQDDLASQSANLVSELTLEPKQATRTASALLNPSPSPINAEPIQKNTKVQGDVSYESLIYCDIGLHVIMDLIDCLTAFRFILLTYKFRGRHAVLERSNGVIMTLGILAHSISLPSFSTKMELNRSAHIEAIERKDIYLTRKYVALISIMIVDVPFLIIRMLFWKKGYSFQIFAIKNIISIALSVFRLNYTDINAASTTETSRAVPAPIATTSAGLNVLQTNTAAAPPTAVDNDNAPPASVKVRQPSTTTREIPTEKSAADKLKGDDSTDPHLFPIEGTSFTRLTRKLVQSVTAGGRHTLAERLDNNLVLPYWKSARLAGLLLLHWMSSISGVALLACWPADTVEADDGTVAHKFDNGILHNTDSSWTGVCILVLSTAGVNFVFHMGTVNILDSMFTSLLHGLRCMTLWRAIYIFREQNLFSIQYLIDLDFRDLPRRSSTTESSEIGFDRYASIVLFLICGAKPVLDLMWGLFYVQSAFLSRRFIYYALQPYSRVARQLASGRGVTVDESATGTTGRSPGVSTVGGSVNEAGATKEDVEVEKVVVPKTDESGWISTASILIYLCCKSGIAPLDYHQLLIGPNLIKGIRISDVLLVNAWSSLTLDMVLRVFANVLTSPLDKPLILLNCVFALVSASYIIFSQSIRLLAIRRFQIKALYTDVVHAWKSDHAQDQAARMEALARILTRYRREALLTSPGDVLPPLL